VSSQLLRQINKSAYIIFHFSGKNSPLRVERNGDFFCLNRSFDDKADMGSFFGGENVEKLSGG